MPELKLDIIHSQHPIYIGYEASRQAKRCGIPLVWTFHSQYDNVLRIYLDWPDFIFRYVMRRLYYRYFSLVDCIIAPTESIRRMVEFKMPLYANLLRMLPTPMDLESCQDLDPEPIRARFNLEGTITLVSVARLGPEKNLAKLVIAFSELALKRPELRLMLIGDGPSRSNLLHLVRQLKLNGQVILTGMVPMAEVKNYLAAGDIYVCSSLTETQGLSLLEAMAVGLPVAAMNAPGSCDIIENERNGLLTPRTVPALKDALERLSVDSQLRTRLGSNARQALVGYEPAKLTTRLVEIYQATIDTYQARAPHDLTYAKASMPAG